MLRRPYLWIALLFMLLFGGAIIGGYTLLPGIVRSQGRAWVETRLPGKLLTMGAIAFDPWTLTLDTADIAIADSKAPQAPLVALKALKVDASLSSLRNGQAGAAQRKQHRSDPGVRFDRREFKGQGRKGQNGADGQITPLSLQGSGDSAIWPSG